MDAPAEAFQPSSPDHRNRFSGAEIMSQEIRGECYLRLIVISGLAWGLFVARGSPMSNLTPPASAGGPALPSRRRPEQEEDHGSA